MEQHIHHCTTPDGVHLAYATVGQGPPMVKVANWLSHLEYDWHSPVWRHWLEGLAQTHELIGYDERGCGLSSLNIGSVTAGTVGRAKLQYDLWGDSVNIASRMESHGVAGKIKVTRQVVEQIKDHFVFQPRGKITVKGMGEMETWSLTGRIDEED